MMFFRAIGLTAALLMPVSAVPAADEKAPAPAGEVALSADELNLDRLISVYEDVATALSSVDDSTDADLVASRVAADFLLLRGMGQALFTPGSGAEVNSDTLRSFHLRRERARTAVEAATARLRENSCYGSEALPAALSLSGLISGKAPTGPAAETAAQELLSNNREMMSLLLDEATDSDSAEQVANLIGSALRCEAALSAYVEEVGKGSLDSEQLEFYAQRRRDFHIDLRNHRERLEPQNYYGNAFLREFIEGLLTLPQQ